MKKIITFLFMFFVITANCYAQSVAIELQENNKFAGIVGKAFITDDTIEVVTLAKVEGVKDTIAPYAFLYEILEKTSRETDVFHVKCQNQLGVIFSGTINLKDKLHPKIILISDRGLVLTNISEDGSRMREKYLKYLDLGR